MSIRWGMQRRFWQFSMATLMGLMLLFAVSASLVGSYWREVHRREAAFQKLSSKGFSLAFYGDTVFSKRGSGRGWCATGQTRLIDAQQHVSQFAEEDLALFDVWSGSIVLDLRGENVSDRAVADFRTRHPDCRIQLDD